MGDDQRHEHLQDRKHRFVQTEIRSVAFDLFLEKGYDNTTVDEIATAAGISRRTFFRYFETKEDVVIAALAESGDDLERLLRSHSQDDSLFQALRETIAQFLRNYQQHGPRAWKILNLIQSTPRLRARFLLERDSWLPRVTTVLVERGMDRNQAETAAATMLGVITVAYERWHHDRSADVRDIVNVTCDELEALFQQA
jgi:AcrR family transcriptional regulator